MSRLLLLLCAMLPVHQAASENPPENTSLGTTGAWSDISALCRTLQAEGWQPRNPLDETDRSTAEATVWGGRIVLCKVARVVGTQDSAHPAAELTLFLKRGGGNAVEATIVTWATAARQAADLGAGLEPLGAVLPRLGIHLPDDIRHAIGNGLAATEDSGALRFNVSRSTRHSALVSQPDLDPDSIPALSIDISIRDWEADEEEYDE